MQASAMGRLFNRKSKIENRKSSNSEECKVDNEQICRLRCHYALFTIHFSFNWGRGRQVMHLPCKQGHAGALPADSTILMRGTRLSTERSLINFFRWV